MSRKKKREGQTDGTLISIEVQQIFHHVAYTHHAVGNMQSGEDTQKNKKGKRIYSSEWVPEHNESIILYKIASFGINLRYLSCRRSY